MDIQALTPAPGTSLPSRKAGIRQIGLLLFAFAVLGFLWAVRIPIPALAPGPAGNINPDESNHLNVIAYMSSQHGLPPYIPRYQVSQSPPLYHGLMAVVFGAFSSLLDYGHTVLLLRLLSVCMSLGTIWLIYQAGLRLLSPTGAWLAAGCAAGVPMFVSLSAAVNIDNLATLAATGALATLVAGVMDEFSPRRLWTLALWTAAGVSSKVTCLALFPAIVCALWWVGWQIHRPWQYLVKNFALIVAVSLLVIGWWYGRNIFLYGDPFRAEAHKRMWTQNEWSLADYRAAGMTLSRWGFNVLETSWESFWGVFNGMSLHLPSVVYKLLICLDLLSLAGVILILATGRLRGNKAVVSAVLLVFCAALAALYVSANVMTYTPQGRYLFPALLPFGLATAAGWRALFPERLRAIASGCLLLALGALNLFCVVYVPTHL